MTELTDFKIFIDKSWKFTPQVLILIFIGIIAILVVSILAQQLTKTLFIPPEILPPPKEKTILESLTVPKEKRGEIKKASPEIIESLTNPKRERPAVPKEIIESLTAPE